MNKKLTALCFAALLVMLSPLAAQDDIVTGIEQGCATEIEKFCSQVTLGEGRMLACFYAHEDKLSGQCQFALYDATAQLERAVSAINYLASQCANDIDTLCAGVAAGEGQILE